MCILYLQIDINLCCRFGSLNGFEILLSRFQSGRNLTVPVIYALIRPFGLCYELLTVHTIVKYLMPIVVSIFPSFIIHHLFIQVSKNIVTYRKWYLLF